MKIYNILVVGCGVAGISVGVEAKERGISDVLILEKDSQPLSTIRNFYKDGKRVDKDWKGIKTEVLGQIPFQDSTKEKTIELFDEVIRKWNLNIQYKTEVEKIEKSGEVFSVFTISGEKFFAKNIVLAIGKMGKPRKPNYPIPAKIRKFVDFNLDNIQDGEKVLVVGGGNSALEYASEIAKNGKNEITLTYRGGVFSKANPNNIEIVTKLVEKNKMSLKLSINIRYLSENSGKIQVHFDHEEIEEFDRVIYAIGGVVPTQFLKNCGVVENQIPKNLFLVGDISPNGGSIAKAINQAYNIVLILKH